MTAVLAGLGLAAFMGGVALIFWLGRKFSRAGRDAERVDRAEDDLKDYADAVSKANAAARADLGPVDDGLREHGRLRD